MRNVQRSGMLLARVVISSLALGLSSVAFAEPYIGAGIGKSAVELDNFDEDDTAHKLIVGYVFDLPAIDFSLEGNYVDFGSPNDGASGTELDITGIDALALVGVDFGVVGVFGKAGVIAWDADTLAPGFAGSDDGTDSVYGVGVRFNVASVFIRTEYEIFDIEAADDLNLFSASVVWRF